MFDLCAERGGRFSRTNRLAGRAGKAAEERGGPPPARGDCARSPVEWGNGVEQLEQRALLSSFAWTAQEVYLLELVNRARANPAAEQARINAGLPESEWLDLTDGLTSGELARLVPQEPLALNQALTEAARLHSQDMLTRNFFDHINPDGKNPTARAQDRGYAGTVGENIAAGYDDIDEVHEAWLRSVGHRKNVLSLHSNFDASFHYDEFGPGFYHGSGVEYDDYISEEFGYQGSDPDLFVLGVVYTDGVLDDDFYTVGEGLSGVRVDVALASAPNTVIGTYTTDAAGNYQIPLENAGNYVVTFTRLSNMFTRSVNVSLTTKNVKVDTTVDQLLVPDLPDDYADAGDTANAHTIEISEEGDGVWAGEIETTPDTDLFAFTAQASATTLIRAASGGSLDAKVRLFNSSGFLLASGSNTGTGNKDSLITLSLIAGQKYYLQVESDGASSIGEYAITIDAQYTAPDDYADAGELGSAQPISINAIGDGSASGTLELSADTDLFTFTAGVTATTSFYVTSNGSLDALVRVYNSVGTLIGTGTNAGDGTDSSLALSLTQGQVYYVLVSSTSAASRGSYIVNINADYTPGGGDDAADEGEFGSATPITLNGAGDGSITGELETTDDTDLFTFVAGSSTQTSLRVISGGVLDAQLRLYNSVGTLIGTGVDAGSGGLGSKLTATLVSGQTYYLLVSAAVAPTSGGYTVSIDADVSAELEKVLVEEDARVVGGTAGGLLAVSYRNGSGRPMFVFQNAEHEWESVDLLEIAGGTDVESSVVTWEQVGDSGRVFAAAASDEGLLLFTRDPEGNWSFRNVTAEKDIGEAITSNITLFFDRDGRGQIVGLAADGSLLHYRETKVDSSTGEPLWAFTNIFDGHLNPNGFEMPNIVGSLSGTMTPDKTLQVFGVDAEGHIHTFWREYRSGRGWRTADLTELTDAPALEINPAVHQRRRDVIVSTSDAAGDLWVLTYTRDRGWHADNYSELYGTGSIVAGSMSSFANRFGMNHIVALNDSGEVIFFWFKTDGTVNRVSLTSIISGAPTLTGPLSIASIVGTNGVSVVGADTSGHAWRFYWEPGTPWAAEDISQSAELA